jgi:Repeat of unknown function (DUF5907)
LVINLNRSSVLDSPVAELSPVAMSGSYNDLSNKPIIPATTSQLINNSEFVALNDVFDLGGKFLFDRLPPLAIANTFPVASAAEMTALTAEIGDIAIRTDLSKTFILKAEPASTIGNWQELLTPTDSVTSVNGKVGVVSLSATDIPGLSVVALSGSYSDLTNKPTIPSAFSQLSNDLGFVPLDTILNQKGIPNGFASLDPSGKLYPAQVPSIAIENIPGLGTAAGYNIPVVGSDAAISEVVLGGDTRLSDSRPPSGAAGGALTGSYPSPGIANKAVTYAKIQDVSPNRLLGNPTGTAGAPVEIQLTGGLLFTAGILDFNPTNQSGLTPVAKGGTGASTTAAALTNLGAMAASLRDAPSGVAGLDSSAIINQARLPGNVAWTPGLRGSSNAGAFTVTGVNYGRSQRFNNHVFINARYGISAITTAPTGTMRITGLPVTVSMAASGYHQILVFVNANQGSTVFDIIAVVIPNTTTLNLFKRSGGLMTALVPADISSSTFDIFIQGFYPV